MRRGLCKSVTLIVATFAFLATIHAAPSSGSSCQKYGYTITSPVSPSPLYTALYEALKKGYPASAFKGSFFQGSKCTATGTGTLNFQGDYTILCNPFKLPPSEYLCVNDRNKRVGDVTLRAEFTATCKNLSAPGKTSCTVVKVNKVTDITKKPARPVPPPKGVWMKVPVFFLPKNVEDAVDKTVASVAPIKEAAPLSSNYISADNNAAFGTGYYERKVDAKGTTWKLHSIVTTESLAGSSCQYPKLQQEITTMPFESNNGVISVPKQGIVISKAKIIDGKDEEEPPACIGGAAWKQGMDKATEFIKSQ